MGIIFYGWEIVQLQRIFNGFGNIIYEWVHINHTIVITAAVGLDIRYDPSVRHYKYPIQDVKT